MNERELNSRATSVTGFVQLLKAAKSNTETSQKSKTSKSSKGILPDSVCFEILGIFYFYFFSILITSVIMN